MPQVAILGAGPAGASAAIALARAGFQVTLFDEPAPPAFRAGECLPPNARPLLRELGVFEQFRAGGHLPCYGNASAWGSAELHTTDFIRNPHGNGWHLDRAAFDRMMLHATCQAGAALRVPGPDLEVERSGTGWKIGSGYADWLIDCTGRKAWLARRLGVRRAILDSLVSHVAVFQAPQSDPDGLTLIESVPEGWWYTAAIPGNRRVAAFHTDSGSAADLALRAPAGFHALLAETRHTRARLAGYELLYPPSVRPANTIRLEQFAGERWLAAGDAAAAYDPLSSQGILTALDSGLRAARALIAGISPIEQYAPFLESQFASYLRLRAEYYRLESRWSNHTFWKSRASE
jgi:flavin-dependent dehydrogenase